MNAEGWYLDPFRIHDARWFSDGIPTQLVRDGGIESQDPPPIATYDGQLQRIIAGSSPRPDDLRRADDGGGAETGAAVESPWSVFDESAGAD